MNGPALPGLPPALGASAPASWQQAGRDAPLALQLVPAHAMEARRPAPDEGVERRIVLTALALAQGPGGWDAVHLHAVAGTAGVTMEELHRHFPDKDAITEGLFDLADGALTAAGRGADWPRLTLRERLFASLMAWLDVLAPHRRVVVDMLGYKMHPEHIHLQVRGVARISRTVQWWREVALSPATGWRRELEETLLTTIYLATFARWATDASPGAQRTARQLRLSLALAERGGSLLGYAR